MRLYEIADGIREIMAAADERDGLLTDEDLAKLDGLDASFHGKVEAICKLVREDDAEVAGRQAEVDRLQAGIAAARNRQKRLKEYLQQCLAQSGQRRVETGLFKVWIQANGSPSCTCLVEPAGLPPELQRVKIEPDNAVAVEVWKQTGKAPDGFEIVRGEHLRIK